MLVCLRQTFESMWNRYVWQPSFHQLSSIINTERSDTTQHTSVLNSSFVDVDYNDNSSDRSTSASVQLLQQQVSQSTNVDEQPSTTDDDVGGVTPLTESHDDDVAR